MIDKNLKNLEKLITVLDQDAMTQEDFIHYFEQIIAFVKSMKDMTEKEMSDMTTAYKSALSEIMANNKDNLSNMKGEIMKYCMSEMSKVMRDHEKKMEEIDMKMDMVEDGKDADEERVINEVLSKIPPVKELEPETPEGIRNKLENLTGKERLSKNAIDGMEELEKKIKEQNPRGVSVFGSRGLQLYVDGAKKGLVQYLNLIPGTGVTLTYSSNFGRNDITISASTSALTLLTATGTKDDANKDFTFASKPSIVIVNGASYQENAGWTWVEGTLTATLSFPVGTGGNIYAIG